MKFLRARLIKAMIFVSLIGATSFFRLDDANAGDRPREPWLGLGVQLTNAVKEEPPEESGVADYYEVCNSSLSGMPIVLKIGLGVERGEVFVPLVFASARWTALLEFSVTRDGLPVAGCDLDVMRDYERAISFEEGLSGNWRDARRHPDKLKPGEGLVALFSFTCDGSPEVEVGTYRLHLHFAKGGKDVFGIDVARSKELVFRVKACDPIESASIEDDIERHYLWGVWLYKVDRAASRTEFEKAWALVQEYLKCGAGDEPGFWNATPRYQAALIAGWLDMRKEQIRYLQHLLGKNTAAKNGDLKLKMRYYHFGYAQDQLPHNLADDLAGGLNRTYEQVYGKTMRGEPIDRLPMRKNFPDEQGDP